jgi:hypothetical protein
MGRRTFVTRAVGSIAAVAALPAVGRVAEERKPIRIASSAAGPRTTTCARSPR